MQVDVVKKIVDINDVYIAISKYSNLKYVIMSEQTKDALIEHFSYDNKINILYGLHIAICNSLEFGKAEIL